MLDGQKLRVFKDMLNGRKLERLDMCQIVKSSEDWTICAWWLKIENI